ncbi:MAG: DNA-processing protein DprA [Spirochaetota bacterium]
MQNNMLEYAVALSLVSAPSQNNIWENCKEYPPPVVYNDFLSTESRQCQGHIAQVYSGSPLEVSSSILKACQRGGFGIVTFWDEQYPSLLREIARPPLVLYYLGADVTTLNRNTIAMVGTRKSDARSSSVAVKIASELAKSGFTVVSGMAVGIDRQAHCGALDSGGVTIGVLAHGIDKRYPYSNRDIYNRISESEHSLLLSEYPPGINAVNWTFARRNRIISGMSMGTVIVKAAQKSGALITARYACEQNREVFVCPGMAFDEEYEGCIRLIQTGATPVFNTSDIIDGLPGFWMRTQDQPGKKVENHHVDKNISVSTPKEIDGIPGLMVNILRKGDMEIDELVRQLQLSSAEVNEAIVMLELSSIIRREGNMVGIV